MEDPEWQQQSQLGSKSSASSSSALAEPLLPAAKPDAKPSLLRRIVEKGKMGRGAKAKADLFNLTANLRAKWLTSMGESVRDYVLYDPDMPIFVNKAMKGSFDKFWNDCGHELERTFEACLIEYEDDANKPGPTGEGFYGMYCAVRALVLHHFFPYNRTMFGKYQDPVYLCLFTLTLLPVHGLRCLLYLVLFRFQSYPGPSDEYQMVNFILNFKGLQFFSNGILAMIRGAWAYYACYAYHKVDVLGCINSSGPGANETGGQVFDYLGNIGLCWVAYLELPRSVTVPLQANTEVQRTDFVLRSKAASERLLNLMCYDLAAFILSMVFFLYFTFNTGGFLAWSQFQENIYWCSVMYSLSALPFSFFYLPIVQYLLIHRDATGFNEYGACVTFALPNPQADESETLSPEQTEAEPVTTGTTVIEHLNRVVRWADLGRQKRGGDLGEYTAFDIARGAMTRLKENTVGDKESNLLGLGKKFRTGDADAHYQFGDISRGIKWKVKTMGLTADNESAEFQDNRPLYIVPGSLRIPEAMPIPGQKNKHVYTVVVILAGNTEMADGNWEDQKKQKDQQEQEWSVQRRYSEFRNLMARLGPRSLSYEDAPFPRRHMSSMSMRKVESRRQGLEVWLRKVVDDPKANDAPWAGYLRAFIDPHWEDTACSTFISMASGFSGQLPTEFSDSDNEEHVPILPRLTEEPEGMEHERTAEGDDAERYHIGTFKADDSRRHKRTAVTEDDIPVEFFQMASFVHSDGSEDEVEKDMFGDDSASYEQDASLLDLRGKPFHISRICSNSEENEEDS